MAIITEPVSEMAILSSEKTRQTALALKGAGIISWQMPEGTYGVFDAVVDGGAEFNEAFSLESLYNPVESDEYSWNWCVKLQGFRKEILKNIAGFGYDQGYSAGKCVICGDYCSMCLEELTEWAALKRGGSRVVCENCANGGIWPTCVGV